MTPCRPCSCPVSPGSSGSSSCASSSLAFRSVALPLAGPALATLAVITFLAFWNEYLWPLIICQDNCTLPPGLKSLQRQFTGDPGLVMAGAITAAVPVLLLYLVLQRYIVQSVASTG